MNVLISSVAPTRLLRLIDWEAIQETVHLMSAPSLRESIRKGMAESLPKSASNLKW